jgi:hypothetical protein
LSFPQTSTPTASTTPLQKSANQPPDATPTSTPRRPAFQAPIKAALFHRGLEWTDRLQSLQGELNAELEPLNTELRALNAAWETAPPIGSPERVDALPLHRLEEISRVVSHLSRWSEQLQDRIVRLSF